MNRDYKILSSVRWANWEGVTKKMQRYAQCMVCNCVCIWMWCIIPKPCGTRQIPTRAITQNSDLSWFL